MINLKEINYKDQETLTCIKTGHAHFITPVQGKIDIAYPYYMLINDLTFEDLVIINVLAIRDRVEDLDKYISMRNNPSCLETNTLSQFTETTGGLFIFQEQILAAIHHFTNWEFEKVDLLRKTMGKRKVDTEVEKNFISCFTNKNEGQNIYKILQDNYIFSMEKTYIENETKLFFFFAYHSCHEMALYNNYSAAFYAHIDKFIEV